LYLKLVEQINKDFNLANEAIDSSNEYSFQWIKIQLHEKNHRLIHTNSEHLISMSLKRRKMDGSDLVILAEPFLIL
jgi:hypothetical protein